MTLTLRYFITIVFTVLFSSHSKAQTTGKFIKASIGFGSSTSHYKEENPEVIDGFGFYTQGEYVVGITKWFSVRPYAGAIFTSTDEDKIKNPEGYKVETNAFFLEQKFVFVLLFLGLLLL